MDYNNMLTMLIVLGALPLVTAFKCYTCVHLKSNVPIPTLASFTEDQACHDGDVTKMKSAECAAGTTCGKSTAEIAGSVLGVDFTAEMTGRGCSGLTSTTNECHTVSDPSAMNALNGITGVTKAVGTGCICTTDNCNGQSMPAPAIFTFVISLVMVIFVSL